MTHELAKADQIAHRCYSKLCLLLHDARSLSLTPPNPKTDRWFNLETPDLGATYKESVAPYRALSSVPSPPPLELEVLLSVPELAPNQVLVHRQPNGGPRVPVEPSPRLVLLETWTLSFGPGPATSEGDLTPAGMYKHGIAVFRAVYSLLRVLPVWALRRRLARRSNFGLIFRVRSPATATATANDDVLRFGRALSPAAAPLPTRTVSLPGVPHPSGSLSLTIRHLEHPHGFGIDERESLLSSRLLSLDADNDFTPTLVKHANATSHTRDSLSSEPSTAALKTSLPASPPQAVGGRHARTTSFPVQGGVGVSASPGRPSVSGSSREYGPMPAAVRLRKESTGSGRSAADLPSSPGPLPIRRPQLNPLNPFKSSTLSSSPSINSPSPSLRGGTLPLPSRPHASPTSSRQEAMNTVPLPSLPTSITSSGLTGVISTSTGPIPSRQGASTSTRPSPPVPSSAGLPGSAGLPSSLGGRSIEGGGTKRYSSSFGHRRQRDSGDVGSTGTPGSIGAGIGVPGSIGAGSSGSSTAIRERRPSAPGPSTSAVSSAAGAGLGLGGAGSFEDDDLSTFVSLTDAPRPLNRHYRANTTDPYSHADLAAMAADPSYTSNQQSGTGTGIGQRARPPHVRAGSFGSQHSHSVSQPASHTGSPLRPPGHISPLGSPGPHPRRGGSPSLPPSTSRAGYGTSTSDVTSPVTGEDNALGLGGIGIGGQLLTSQAAIDARLEGMNDRFAESLRALGSRRRERTQSSPGPSTSTSTSAAVGEGRAGFTGFRRADRISEVTEESTVGTATSTQSSTRGGFGGGRSGSTSNAGSVSGRGGYSGSSGSLRRPDSVGSEEVIGKLELDHRGDAGGRR
ncbi:hypothetical protein PENSPDRAFT_749484 [Peniophora sp. CONT]|nr:hypothetical protein PENSPDRAFT_749484 [Peniophora sp. CONT]